MSQGSTGLPRSQASRQATRTLVILNNCLDLAASTLGVDVIPALTPSHFPIEVFSDEESGPEDCEDEVARTFASYGAQYQLPIGGFILRRPKPYLSTSVRALDSFQRNTHIDHLHIPDEEAYGLRANPVQIAPW